MRPARPAPGARAGAAGAGTGRPRTFGWQRAEIRARAVRPEPPRCDGGAPRGRPGARYEVQHGSLVAAQTRTRRAMEVEIAAAVRGQDREPRLERPPRRAARRAVARVAEAFLQTTCFAAPSSRVRTAQSTNCSATSRSAVVSGVRQCCSTIAWSRAIRAATAACSRPRSPAPRAKRAPLPSVRRPGPGSAGRRPTGRGSRRAPPAPRAARVDTPPSDRR